MTFYYFHGTLLLETRTIFISLNLLLDKRKLCERDGGLSSTPQVLGLTPRGSKFPGCG
jgi:hypothetical protein